MIKRVKLKDVLKQYRIIHWINDNKEYGQVTVSQTGEVRIRGYKKGINIGRKRQFIVDLDRHPNTLLFIRQGVYKGGIGVAPPEVNQCVVTENMPMFDIVGVKPRYLSLYLKSPQFNDNVNKLAPLGTAQKAIHEKRLLELEIPIHSEVEQEKIISKIEFILEKKNRLSYKISENRNLIDRLREAILREAVSGQLVPQDPNEDSASALLHKIQFEKEQMVKDKRIKPDYKKLPPIADKEIPFETPPGWVWARLKEITTKIGSGSTPRGGKKIYEKDGIPFIRSQNVWNTGLELEDVAYIPDEIHKKMNATHVFPGDILLNITGASIGRTSIVSRDFKEGNVSQHVSIIRLVNPSVTKFIHFYLLSPYIQNRIMEVQVGISREGLSKKNMELFLIPLPPISEQYRIIDKLKKLLRSCKHLENTIKENEMNSELLMDAMLKEAFND